MNRKTRRAQAATAKTDRAFSHPNLGRDAKVELFGRDVVVTLTASTEAQAEDLFDSVVRQLEAGGLNLTMMGLPTKVTKT